MTELKKITIGIGCFIIALIIVIFIFFIYDIRGEEYKTPSWQKRAIREYNYDKAIHNKDTDTIGYDKDTPSWQKRAIDNYNYDKATHRNKERKNND